MRDLEWLWIAWMAILLYVFTTTNCHWLTICCLFIVVCLLHVIFNFINSTVSKKSIQHDNFMHIFPLSIFQLPPPCPCLRAPMDSRVFLLPRLLYLFRLLRKWRWENCVPLCHTLNLVGPIAVLFLDARLFYALRTWSPRRLINNYTFCVCKPGRITKQTYSCFTISRYSRLLSEQMQRLPPILT